ncbi:5'/3'-nucleotidase SurE [Asanoa ishikariensis]|uniref:5'-nucleotidase n=1 Tax=Asanoa ishikariensis TaxID=137265 RepID=A0A1H3TUC6_9ACTN|nr:5'/3'-nucleotidase SurE [Asanoa ishikariensis]GIF67502.1 5'/3'-nucleotidase SurE [Asanoa ishikariensis]SDZ53776.1 5'-nucleotidase [Asanoa ishikariensis]
MSPRVLVTNDDGIDAVGIRVLATALAGQGLDTVVAAPRVDASGASAALAATEDDGRVLFERHDLDGVPAYAISGSPAYITLLGLHGAFGPPPDLVVSGINRGANAGRAVLHSGTVGAALTASAGGRRAMAVSLDILSAADATTASGGAVATLSAAQEAARNWDSAARVAVGLVDALLAAPVAVMLNVNVPDLPADRLRGVRRATLAAFGQVVMTVVESGEGYVRTALRQSDQELTAGTDLAVLGDGYAAVTPLRALGEAGDVDLPGLAAG